MKVGVWGLGDKDYNNSDMIIGKIRVVIITAMEEIYKY